jgi:uncharacterized protein YjbI with pentapeptide repeats
MKNSGEMRIKKPTPILKKSLKVDFKEFGKAAAKAAIHFSTAQWDGMAEDGADMLSAIGLKASLPEIAWLLIYRSNIRALRELINEAFGTEDTEYFFGEVLIEINRAIDGEVLTINKKFFEQPESEPLIRKVQPAFSTWLISKGIEASAATSISDRLPAYFAMALHDEWATSSHEYNLLQEGIDTPFTKASERLQRWTLYQTTLVKQVEEPMFNESFSLKRIFVSPRAFFNRKRDEGEPGGVQLSDKKFIRVIVDLQEDLDAWILGASSDDAIRLISGGPGSGKSSFAKMYAAKLSRRSDVNVVFIPLHHFEPAADLIEAVGKYIQAEGILTNNPLGPEYREKRLTIIFDGLDELAMQGKVAERTAQDFVREVQRKVILLNQQKNWLRVIISGRELIVQQSESDFRKEGQILHLLPYYVDKSEHSQYFGGDELISIDQRDIWWKNYGVATGSSYDKLPNELAQEHLVEITSQPLLNYLVALSLRRGKLKFSEETNLNAVYADLLKAIYERGWSNQQHLAIQGIEEEDFSRILEEIALATWHGDGRKTSVREIETHCDNSGLQSLLARFQTGLQQSSTARVTQLLTAFYFRQNGQDVGGDKTFEFTHKSFGEFLTARRIVRELILIRSQLQMRKSSHDLGWSERDCLQRWLTLCGPVAIDTYLYKFLLDELRLLAVSGEDLLVECQDVLARLFGHLLRDGMPLSGNIKEINSLPLFVRCRNAEQALFICLNACARVTERVSKVEWPNLSTFGDWFSKGARREFDRQSVLSECLSYLDLAHCNLKSIFLYQSDISFSILDGASLVGVDLRYSKVNKTSMRGTKFSFANVAGVDFSGAMLSYADFGGARICQFQGRGFGKSKFSTLLPLFEGASLEGATFNGCDLRAVRFSGANLVKASFKGAILNRADFTNCDIAEADFRSAITEDAIFPSSSMDGALFGEFEDSE